MQPFAQCQIKIIPSGEERWISQ